MAASLFGIVGAFALFFVFAAFVSGEPVTASWRC
jgi:hypothetical protein